MASAFSPTSPAIRALCVDIVEEVGEFFYGLPLASPCLFALWFELDNRFRPRAPLAIESRQWRLCRLHTAAFSRSPHIPG
jgi:hypothetical protein